MTNTILAVCYSFTMLTTNISERWPQHMVPIPCPEGVLGCGVFHGRNEPDANPTNKWVRTTVTEITNLVVELDGGKHSNVLVLGSRTQSDTEQEFRLVRTEAWKPGDSKDLRQQSSGTIWITNGILHSTLTVTNRQFKPTTNER